MRDTEVIYGETLSDCSRFHRDSLAKKIRSPVCIASRIVVIVSGNFVVGGE